MPYTSAECRDPLLDVSRKTNIRRLARARRLAAQAAGPEAAQHMRDVFLAHFRQFPKVPIGGYCAVGSEMDLRPLLDVLAVSGLELALPCVVAQDQPLLFRSWRPGERLVSGPYGHILEPAPDAPPVRPAIVLTPLLAFDRFGHRAGNGAGYYDRTADHWREEGHDAIFIGIAYACQEFPAVPFAPHDLRLDGVVTEREVIEVKALMEIQRG